MVEDPVGAFIPDPRMERAGAAHGPAAGLCGLPEVTIPAGTDRALLGLAEAVAAAAGLPA